MRASNWMGRSLALGVMAVMAACGKQGEEKRQPAIGPAPGQAAAPAESTADAPDKTGFDSSARDSLQRALDTADTSR